MSNTTDYHAKYFAHELSRSGGSGVARLDRALFDACVDLNPHQIEAAMFALRSPISKGVLLADEVGLGKTIEAGLVVCQYWAEHRRSVLIICPASLRKQWAMELAEKFHLPASILDAKTYRQAEKAGNPNPFHTGSVVICSLHYASRHADDIKAVPWDLVVIDEAHKLRNAYRQSNRIGQQIRWATEDRKTLLVTATPLQNTLIELYGLSTLIDDRLFGDLPAFRSQYVNNGGNLDGLRDRLKSFCWRTLRGQVQEYVRYTERNLITRPFKPSEQEHKLYEAVSAYLKRDDTYALPAGQRHLLILLVRKVLASSPRAVAGTLEIMRDRLKALRKDTLDNAPLVDRLLLGQDINYDLPWNPQRIEQRIGRCHRYGQEHDVVVINFLNERNEADRRVYQLLEQKFHLFSGLFGASDDVLGSIESGVDFERRVLDIYQQCRSAEDIQTAFEKLQAELDEQIQTKMKDTRRLLLEHFDEDVHERLRVNLTGARERLDRIGRMFWRTTRHILDGRARFHDADLSFDLDAPPIPAAQRGRYHLVSKQQDNIPGEFLYRLSHPLGEHVISDAKQRDCPTAEVAFDISSHDTRIALVEKLQGNSGWLLLQHLRIDSFERKKRKLRERIFDIEDEIVEKRDRLVEALEKRMEQKTTATPLFTIRWKVL